MMPNEFAVEGELGAAVADVLTVCDMALGLGQPAFQASTAASTLL